MKTCEKCKDKKEDKHFYKKRRICKDCFKEHVYARREVYRPKANLEPVPETIKTVPWKTQVNHELYQYLLQL